jgi:hypothetical protein
MLATLERQVCLRYGHQSGPSTPTEEGGSACQEEEQAWLRMLYNVSSISPPFTRLSYDDGSSLLLIAIQSSETLKSICEGLRMSSLLVRQPSTYLYHYYVKTTSGSSTSVQTPDKTFGTFFC